MHADRLVWIDRLNAGLATVGGMATIALMLHVTADVAARFLGGAPLPGTLDATQYGWMPMVVALGLGYALLRGEHIRVNLLTAPTGERTQRVIEIVGMTFTLATTGLFLWFGAVRAMENTRIGTHSPGAAWLPTWPFQWVVIIGLAGLLLQACAQLYRAFTVAEFVPDDEDEAVVALETAGMTSAEVSMAEGDGRTR
jgi:TRAP-type mannitol/chloroaromatic compound transport system permease small subunit